MKKAYALLALVLFGCSAQFHTIDPPSFGVAKELEDFKPETPESWTLPNGLKVFYLSDPEVPLVRGQLFMRGGSLWEPDSNAGVVPAMGELLRKGGAGAYSADDLDTELVKLAAGIGSQFGAEFGSVQFSCLSQDIDKVFSLFSSVLLEPRFEKERLNLWKGQVLEGIRRRVEDPDTVAGTSIQQILYQGSPYGRVLLPEHVARISRESLYAAQRRWVNPKGAILVVTGDITKEKVAQLVVQHLAKWDSTFIPPTTPPPLANPPVPGIYFVMLPFSQSSIIVAQLGVPRLTPDFPAIDAFNEIFGTSGFGSRLMTRVRTELGLAYVVGGSIQPGVVQGMNSITVQTKSSSVGEAITEGIKVLQEMQSKEVTATELADKKRAIANSFIFNFESPQSIASRRAKLELLKYPVDYDETYLSLLEKVTPADVQKVAQNRWNIGQFVTVVVGDEAAYTALEKTLRENKDLGINPEIRRVQFDSALQLP